MQQFTLTVLLGFFMWSVAKIELLPCALQSPSCLVEWFLEHLHMY